MMCPFLAMYQQVEDEGVSVNYGTDYCLKTAAEPEQDSQPFSTAVLQGFMEH